MRSTLPDFPEFEKLSLAHKDLLNSIAKDFPSSDFNFSGLFTWDVGEIVAVCTLNGNLVMRSSDYLTHEQFYSFIGNNLVDETIKTLTDYARQRGESTKLRLVPETVIKHIKRPDLHRIEEDPDNHDYIHLLSDFEHFDGSKFERKRNLLHKFAREHGQAANAKELDLHDQKTRSDIAKVIDRWASRRNLEENGVRDDLKAIGRALEHHQALGMRAFGVYKNGELIAFTLFEILPNKVAVGHFEKADTSYKGVFEYLNHSFAKHLVNLGIELINTEQDLGIDSLRKSKQSYQPHHYIKKYTLERLS